MAQNPVYTYFHATTATGLAIKRGPGVLGGVSINKATVGTITLLDGSSTIGVIAAATPAGMYFNNRTAFSSLSATLTTAAEDITIHYE